MDINQVIINIQKEQIEETMLKLSNLLNKMLSNYSNININNSKLLNIKNRLDILESNLEYINNDIEELVYDIDDNN